MRDEGVSDTISGLVKWLYSQVTLLLKARGTTDAPTSVTSRHSSYVSMSPGIDTMQHQRAYRPQQPQQQPGCPLHPTSKNHYLKACRQFRNSTQHEKFSVMRRHGICFRCGHDNCAAGQPPFNHTKCSHASACKTPSCGKTSHFTAICPAIHGLDGYGLHDVNHLANAPLNPTAPYLSTQREHR